MAGTAMRFLHSLGKQREIKLWILKKSVYILCQMLFIWFFLRHKMDLVTDPCCTAGPAGALEVECQKGGFSQFPSEVVAELIPPWWGRPSLRMWATHFFFLTRNTRLEEKKMCVSSMSQKMKTFWLEHGKTGIMQRELCLLINWRDCPWMWGSKTKTIASEVTMQADRQLQDILLCASGAFVPPLNLLISWCLYQWCEL